jgi:hypothetical protein
MLSPLERIITKYFKESRNASNKLAEKQDYRNSGIVCFVGNCFINRRQILPTARSSEYLFLAALVCHLGGNYNCANNRLFQIHRKKVASLQKMVRDHKDKNPKEIETIIPDSGNGGGNRGHRFDHKINAQPPK